MKCYLLLSIAVLFVGSFVLAKSETVSPNFETLKKAVENKWNSFTEAERQQLRQKALALATGKVKLNTSNDDLVHQWAKETKCNRTRKCWDMFCDDVCEIGSVELDPWLQYALKTQTELQWDTPLNYTVLPGTHNSCISKAYGHGLEETVWTEWVKLFFNGEEVVIANQQFSLTDQMNFGVRHIELDAHWFEDAVRICHAGGVHLQEFDSAIKWIAKELGISIDWDSETLGCFGKNNRLLNTTFEEIRNWITKPEHAREVLIFMFDDQGDMQEWGKVHLIIEGLRYYFGDLLFTPPEKKKKLCK